MKIERFEIPGLAQYSYMISAGGKAAVIDAIRDVDRYTEYASKEKLQITHVLETHIHADFAAGSIALCQIAGAELALSAYDKDEHYCYAMLHRPLRDGDTIEIGSVRIRALHTPGHTPEHLSFVVIDTDRSATVPVALMSGDFLFVGGLGRPDLLGEPEKVRLAHELFRSLHSRIASLPDGVALYPGHGAGSLCGAGMGERAESTLGYERATNPLFRLSKEEFVREVLASVPPMPSYYPRMKELNAAGASTLAAIPGNVALSEAAVAELSSREDVVVLDLRRPEAFGGAHVPDSINIGAGQNLSLWAGWLLDPAKWLVLISDIGDDAEARRSLVRVGLDRIQGYLSEGMPAWIDAGLDFTRIDQVPVQAVKGDAPQNLILDVRSDKEWESGHIEGATHVMLGSLPTRLDDIPRDRPIITVCGSGYRSSIAASLLKRAEIDNVSSMDGGMAAWHHRKLATVR